MNNVYIGARYVPIFDGEWSDIKSYEPLTIVIYGNNSYTSKKPVPAGVTPLTTEYWANTGNFNGQISVLQNEINALSERLTDSLEDIEEEIAEIRSIISSLTSGLHHTIVYIGDSFMYGPSHLTTAIDSKLIVDNSYNFSYGATGFVRNTDGKSFPNQLQNAAEDTSFENSSVTDIIICGGINDAASTTQSEFETAMSLIKSKRNMYFVNAKIWVVPMVWGTSNFIYDDQAKYNKIYNASINTGLATLPDAYAILQGKDASVYMLDETHPSDAGCALIASNIASWICGGPAIIEEHYVNNSVPTTQNDTGILDVRKCYGHTTLTLFLYLRNGTYAANTKICDVPSELVQDANLAYPCSSCITAGTFDGNFYLKNGGLYADQTVGSVDAYVNVTVPFGYVF